MNLLTAPVLARPQTRSLRAFDRGSVMVRGLGRFVERSSGRARTRGYLAARHPGTVAAVTDPKSPNRWRWRSRLAISSVGVAALVHGPARWIVLFSAAAALLVVLAVDAARGRPRPNVGDIAWPFVLLIIALGLAIGGTWRWALWLSAFAILVCSTGFDAYVWNKKRRSRLPERPTEGWPTREA
jgi:hypothetical protein